MSVWEEGQQILHEEEMEHFRKSREDDEDYGDDEDVEEVALIDEADYPDISS